MWRISKPPHLIVVNVKEWDKIKEKVVLPGSVHEADQCHFVLLKVGN